MLFKRLPDPTDKKLLAGFLWANETVVVHDHAQTVAYARHIAPLTLKATLSGAERYNVHGFFDEVSPGEYLLINDGQAYESAIDADDPVESLCLFFSDADIADARRSVLADEAALDDPELHGVAFEVPAVKRKARPWVVAALAQIPLLRAAPALRRQSHAVQLLAEVLRDEKAVRSEGAPSAARASTRTELRRRCAIGKAYIEAMYAQDIGLREIAAAAGLSRTHFLRAFADCYGETPYQALRRRRLEQAAFLLANHSHSVSDIAMAVGYENFSAFTRAFKSLYRTTPSSYRG